MRILSRTVAEMVSVGSRQATDLVTLEALEPLLSRSVNLPNLWLSQEKDGFSIHPNPRSCGVRKAI